MPEPSRGRVCARCGQENPVGATRCAECGEAFGGAVLLHEQEPRAGYAGPWWQSEAEAEERIIPLPPQLREEQERVQRVAEERARWAEERRIAEAAGRAARQAAYEQALRRQERAQHRLEQRQRELEDAAAAYERGTTPGYAAQEQATQEQQYGPRVTVRTVEESTHTQHVSQVTQVSEAQPRVRTGTTNPTVAAVSSALVPGLGQFMNGQGAKALLLLLGFLVATFVFSQSPVGLLIIAARILAAVDAYRIATRRRAGKPIRDGEWDLG